MGGAPLQPARFFILSAVVMTLMVIVAFPVRAEPHPPQTHGAWSVECKPRAGSPENVCVASQLVTTGKAGKQVVLGVIVAPAKGSDQPHIVFRISPDANRDAGAAVKIDEQEAFRVPISQCDTLVCEVRSLMPVALLAQMRTGKLLKFAFFIGKQQVTYPVSLEGFNAAFADLQKTPE